MKTLLLLLLSLCALNAFAQETDDMYYTLRDRRDANIYNRFRSTKVDSTLDLKSAYAYTGRDVNPDYTDRPAGYSKYFDQNYQNAMNDGSLYVANNYNSANNYNGYNYLNYNNYGFFPYGYPYNSWSYMYGMYPMWNNYGSGPIGYGYAYGMTPGYMYNGYYNPIVVSGIRINVNRNHEIGFVGTPYGRRPTRSTGTNATTYYQRSQTQRRSNFTSQATYSRSNSPWVSQKFFNEPSQTYRPGTSFGGQNVGRSSGSFGGGMRSGGGGFHGGGRR